MEIRNTNLRVVMELKQFLANLFLVNINIFLGESSLFGSFKDPCCMEVSGFYLKFTVLIKATIVRKK